MGLWNCQSVVNKADLITAIASQTALNILGLTETWICPEDSAILLRSLTTSLSLTPPCQVRKGGGMYVRPKKVLLISARCLYKRHLGARNLADQIFISLIKMQINVYNFVEMRFF